MPVSAMPTMTPVPSKPALAYGSPFVVSIPKFFLIEAYLIYENFLLFFLISCHIISINVLLLIFTIIIINVSNSINNIYILLLL